VSSTFIFVAQAVEYNLSVGNRHHVCKWSIMRNTEFVIRKYTYSLPTINRGTSISCRCRIKIPHISQFVLHPNRGDPQVPLLFSPTLCIFIFPNVTPGGSDVTTTS